MRTDFSSSTALKTLWPLSNHQARATRLARLAREALIAEAQLTPKPGLVDRRGAGAHTDLSLSIMERSAFTIEPYFREMAFISEGAHPSQALREELAVVGRDAERAMLKATNGSNSHKGAIWILGLLISAAAVHVEDEPKASRIAATAKESASFEDRAAPRLVSHGDVAAKRYGVAGARGEARRGFPHVIDIGLPMLRSKRASGATEHVARLDTLLSIMSRSMTLAYSTAEEKKLSSPLRQVLLLWRAPAVVEPQSVDRNYFVSTAGFSRWESPLVAAEICWRQLCSLMPSSGNKKKCKRTEADRRIKMEQIEFNYPAKRKVQKRTHVGVVGSGDLEVLLEPAEGDVARVFIRTSVDGFRDTWRAVLDRFFANYDGAARIQINDAGATPGIVQLRLEQAVEVSER